MTLPGASAGGGAPRGRTRIFQDLMRHRVRHIVLVSSLYDSFILSEDGQINDALGRQFADLRLNENPDLIRVSSGAEALAMARGDTGVDMIITSIQPGDMNAAELARQVKAAGFDIPVVLLAYSHRELTDFLSRHPRGDLDRIYLWQGDTRLLLAMVKDQEDRLNLERDTGRLGVPAILVVEDSIRYYSAFLPVIYAELMAHSQQLITEGLNLSQKMLRMRARPKIILCETFEAAWEAFTRYEASILGIVSDFEFPRAGVLDRGAGAELVARVHAGRPDIPIVMQSSIAENEAVATGMNAAFLLKGSPLLLHGLRAVLLRQFGFGPFVFRLPDGTEIDEAQDLRTLVDKLRTVPTSSLAYHAERNHFSMWLKARTEYTLAERLRPRRMSDYATLEDLRQDLVQSISAYRLARDRAVVADFRRTADDRSISMARIGAGSLGGKARGLAFVNRLLLEADVAGRFPGVRIEVPPAVVLGTDIFDQFLEENELYDFALSSTSEEEIGARFAAARFPGGALRDLRAFLRRVDVPLSVRSSGLLEDSPSQPLAGVYRTIMVSNRGTLKRRLDDLVAAVKSVYASTFSGQAKAFVRTTPFRLEQEKMAVIIQHIVGAAHGSRFYPDISGVARSRNVYPAPPVKSEDGVAAVALGLGRAVVEGDACVQFCPRYPRHALAYSSIETALNSSQREFYALDLSGKGARVGPEGWSSPASACARPRRTARWPRSARPTWRRTTPSRTASGARGSGSSPSRRFSSTASFRSPTSSTPCSSSAATAPAPTWRLNSPSTCRCHPGQSRCSAFSRCGRWSWPAPWTTSRSTRSRPRRSSAAATRSSGMAASTTCAMSWSSTRSASTGCAASRSPIRWRASMPCCRSRGFPICSSASAAGGRWIAISAFPSPGARSPGRASSSNRASGICGSRRRRARTSSRT